MRRDRAARTGPELFLYERAFADCLERIELMQRRFARSLLIGCPDPGWPERLRSVCEDVDVRDPGELFAQSARGSTLVEDAWLPPEQVYGLVLAVGTLDTVNDPPLALRLLGHALQPGGLLIGAMPGGETLPRLREAMRAADLADGGAAPHVHPRIEPAALAPLLTQLEQDARCAIVAPQVLDPDGSPQGNARGDPDMFTGLFGRTGALRRTLPGLQIAQRNVVTGATDAGASIVVDWVSGACLVARRTALADVGGFDERYFMYWEDADLCRRLRQRGYRIRYVPAAVAVHRVGQSSKTARASSLRAFHRSAYLYYATHVARGVLNPKRWLARVLLTTRLWWKLRSDAEFRMQNSGRSD